jgi:hypothetical protein
MTIALPLELLYLLQIAGALILATLMGIATVVWFFRTRNVGGTAGNYFTLFYACISMYAVSTFCMVTATSAENATFWGVLSFLHGISGWFFLFLSGEYSITDRPPPIRIMTVGTVFGMSIGIFIYTLLQPVGTGMLLVAYVPSYGWVSHVTVFFIIINLISGFLSNFFYLQFVMKAYRASPNTTFGRRARTLLVTLSIGLWIDVLGVDLGWLLEDFAILSPIIVTISTSVFMIIAFCLLFREYRIIYFMPQKAIGIIILSTEGVVYFDHTFQKDVESAALRDFLGPALTAVNNLVKETLELAAIDWIREFQTDKMVFLLEVRPEHEIVGLLVVSKLTQILRKSFGKFMDSISVLCENTTGDLCNTPEKEKHLHEMCAQAFPFLPPID